MKLPKMYKQNAIFLY